MVRLIQCLISIMNKRCVLILDQWWQNDIETTSFCAWIAPCAYKAQIYWFHKSECLKSIRLLHISIIVHDILTIRYYIKQMHVFIKDTYGRSGQRR